MAEEALHAALKSPHAGARRSALAQMRSMGEDGAGSMGYHVEASDLLEDKEPSVQIAALRALGAMGWYGASMGSAIVLKLHESPSQEVKKAAIQALGELGQEASAFVGNVEAYLGNKDLDLVAESCIALGSMKAVDSKSKVAEKLKDADVEVVIGACIGLGKLGDGEALAGALGSEEARVRAAALGALPKDQAEKYLERACALLSDPDVSVRINAAELISSLGESAAGQAPAFAKLLDSAEVGQRAAGAAVLGGLGPKAEPFIESFERMLGDNEEDTSSLVLSVAGVQRKAPAALRKPACAAAVALGALGTKAAGSADRLAQGLAAEDSEVRAACASALGKLGEAAAKLEDRLTACLDDSSPSVVVASAEALGALAEETRTPCGTVACAKLADLLQSKQPALRAAGLGGLSKMGEETNTYLEEYVKHLKDQVAGVRAQAVGAVAACGEHGQMFASQVSRLLFDEDARVRAAAAGSLPLMGERGAAFTEEVGSLLEDPAPEARVAATKALAAFGANVAGEYLDFFRTLAQGDASPEVRAAAKEAVAELRALK